MKVACPNCGAELKIETVEASPNPLKRGYSEKTISDNIAAEIERGKDREQATAIAYETAREAYRARHPRGPLPDRLKKPRRRPKRVTRRYRYRARVRGKRNPVEFESQNDKAAKRYAEGPLFKSRFGGVMTRLERLGPAKKKTQSARASRR